MLNISDGAASIIEVATTLTTTDVAKILKRSIQFVRGEISRGMLPAAKIGRSWRVTPEDLKQYIDTKRREQFDRAKEALNLD